MSSSDVLDRVTALRNQLAECVYELNAGEFIRFRPEANDDAVAGVVRSVVAEGEEGCDEFRHGLGTDEVDTLRLFAMRRTLLGRRSSSVGPIYEAMDAFALLPGERRTITATYRAKDLGRATPSVQADSWNRLR